MTETEFESFLHELSVTFPDIDTWIEKHSPDRQLHRHMVRNLGTVFV